MNKIVSSPEQAVADIADGATVAIAGFGVAHRFALTEIDVAVAPNVRTME